ncbi:MAG: hypothetical protein RIE52_11905 [Balneola sp.]
MTDKRDALVALMETTLQAFDANYTVTDRLRLATLVGSNRNARVSVMGENYTYCEVMYRSPLGQGDASAGNTRFRRRHGFSIRIWYKYEDNDVYANSSQATWDNIVESSTGVMETIASTALISTFPLFKPENASSTEIFMDSQNEKDLAHYLEFNVDVGA